MIENIHKWLIFRLLIVWLILSILIGGLVNYLGNARLDNHIVGMAKTETMNYSNEIVAYLQSPSKQALSDLGNRIHLQIEKDNLIAVEFYDTETNKITEAVKPSAKEIEAKLPKHGTEFAEKDGTIINKIALGGDTYLRVFVPMHNKEGIRVGSLEGIYHAPEDIITQIKQQTFWSLCLVMLVIFATSLALYPIIIRLNRRLVDYSNNLALTNIGMLKVLGSAVAKRDSDTNIHNYRVTLYSVYVGEQLGLSRIAMQGLMKGAFLHDIGKIAISDAILHKPGKLTVEEFEIMKSHVQHGVDIISGYDWLRDALDVVRGHHEKFDGSGYPLGLKGNDIPLGARIFAVADVFDALTSKRPYKEPFSFDASVGILRESMGTHFDPAITQFFLDHAAALHAEICNDDEALQHGKLGTRIEKYFQ